MTVDVANPSESVFNFDLSSSYLDGEVQIQADNEVVSCEKTSVTSIDGKPPVSHWLVVVSHESAILFCEEKGVSEIPITINAKDGDDSYQMFFKVLVIKPELTSETSNATDNESANASEGASINNETTLEIDEA